MESLYLSDKAYMFLEKFSESPIPDTEISEAMINDDSFIKLLRCNLLTYSAINHETSHGFPKEARSSYSITELGRAYLDNYRNERNMLDSIKSMASSAEEQASAAKAQADIAVAEAEKANDKSLSATLKANKSFIVSVAGVLISVLINLDKIISSSKMLLCHLTGLIQELIRLLQ